MQQSEALTPFYPSWLPWPAASQDVPAALIWVAIFLVHFVFCDFLLSRIIDRSNKGHWFAMHALANLYVVILAAPDLYSTLTDPMNGMSKGGCNHRLWSCNDVATSAILAIHMYHVLAYRNLTADDWFHHILFCTTILPLHFVYSWGVWANTLPFFISGLPGGIDYVLLTLVKTKVIHSLTEKKLNVYLNLWLRAPGLISVLVLNYIGFLYSDHNIPAIPCIGGGMLVLFNAQYYSERVVASMHTTVIQGVPSPLSRSKARRISDVLAASNLREL
eukprot:PhF_6_TR20815/c0_g1_i2/m.29946